MTQATNGDGEATIRPVNVRDVEALIGWLAVVEGEALGGAGQHRLIARLRQRFERAGLLSESDDERAFRQAISDMNQRLRFALGEYTDPPAPLPVAE